MLRFFFAPDCRSRSCILVTIQTVEVAIQRMYSFSFSLSPPLPQQCIFCPSHQQNGRMVRPIFCPFSVTHRKMTCQQQDRKWHLLPLLGNMRVCSAIFCQQKVRRWDRLSPACQQKVILCPQTNKRPVKGHRLPQSPPSEINGQKDYLLTPLVNKAPAR